MRAEMLLRALCAGLLLSPSVDAQSVYVDFGNPASPAGVPSASYGAGQPPGVWNGVSAGTATNLLDVSGAVTTVGLSVSSTPMLDACGQAGTTGDDAALYDDRWVFDPPLVNLTVSGLAPGTYRVCLHVLLGGCFDMFLPLSVAIAGATPATDDAFPSTWGGAPVEGLTYTLQVKSLAAGQNLVLQISAPTGFTSYTQFCGLQVLRTEPPVPFCLGDGSGAACPCGNAGASGHGCANSGFASGALLAASGLPSLSVDSVVLTASALPGPGLFFQSDAVSATPLAFGDGFLCASSGILRLGVVFPTSSTAAYPGGTTPNPVHVAGAPIAAGQTRYYQCWYRDAAVYCTAETFNLTNGVAWTWQP